MPLSPSVVVIGLSYKATPLELREKLLASAPFERAKIALFPNVVSELVGVSTCNRTELYFVTHPHSDAVAKLTSIFDSDCAYVLAGRESTEHLFRVVSGLDSMILGEYDIVAQIKASYHEALQARTVGPILNQLFQRAIHASKIVRSKTKINTGITSMARAAVVHLQASLGNLQAHPILIVGAGNMAQKVGKYLLQAGACDITFANRTYARAKHVASELGAKAIPLSDLRKRLTVSSALICATAAPSYVLDRHSLKEIMDTRTVSLHIVDLGVPRNVEPAAAAISGVSLHNVDNLQGLLDEGREVRVAAVASAQSIIELETQKFWDWYAGRAPSSVPLPLLQAGALVSK